MALFWLVGACSAPASEPRGSGAQPLPTAAAAASAPPPASAPNNTPSATTAASAAPSANAANAAEAPGPVAPPASGYALEWRSPGGGKRAVSGRFGVVTSVEANATRVGIAVLERGGNAVDAAVAVGYALAVTHPSAGNLGGGGMMLIRPKRGATVAIDFREMAPRSLTRARFQTMVDAGAMTPESVGVPGSVAGLNLARERFGTRPLSELVEPAIRLARDGHTVSPRSALTIHWNWSKLRRDPDAKRIFGRGNGALPPGGKLVQPDLAATLERIGKDGNAGFYRGPTAAGIVAGSNGAISLEDLAAYRAVARAPLRIRYRGFDVEAAPPPSAGGVAVVQALLMLERSGAHEPKAGSPLAYHLFLEASRRAHAIRRLTVADPDRLGPAELQRRTDVWVSAEQVFRFGPPISRHRATPSREVSPLQHVGREHDHTTHFTVVDRDGLVVSVTTTLSAGFGSKRVAPGTGVVLNNSVPAFNLQGDSQPEGGRRMTTSMSPTLVSRGGAVVLALGSPGGDTIADTVVQVLRNVIDFRRPLSDAIDAPRVSHRFLPDEYRVEGGNPPSAAVLAALKQLGHKLSAVKLPIGDANDVLVDDEGAHAVADLREGGLALAASR